MRSRFGRAGRRALAVGLLALLVLAGAALAATAGGYSGKTSQHQNVSFRIARGAVHSFKIAVLDKCPDGHTLRVSATYPTMQIKNGRFGGSFVPVGGHPGEKAVLNGSVGRHSVTGGVRDTSYSPREGALCHGTAQFTARHR